MSERIELIEFQIKTIDEKVNRLRSHIESEGGTTERVNKGFTDSINNMNKTLSEINTRLALSEERVKNMLWWIRGTIAATFAILIKSLIDLITKA
jgi:hypothetical protein